MKSKKMNFDFNFIKNNYHNTNGFVKVYSGQDKSGHLFPVGDITSPYAEQLFFKYQIKNQNTKISLCTYKTNQKADMENLNTITAMALQIDYKESLKEKEALALLEEAFSQEETRYPLPTYILSGKVLYLVWQFSSPVCLRIEKRAKKEKMLLWMDAVQEKLCQLFAVQNPVLSVSAVKRNGHIPLPGSVAIEFTRNLRANADGSMEFKWERSFKKTVKMIPVAGAKRLSLEELSSAVFAFPDKAGDEAKCKREKRKGKKVSITSGRGYQSFFGERMEFLRCLQKAGWDEGEQKTMCFLLWETMKGAGVPKMQARLELKRFNQEFMTPLDEAALFSTVSEKGCYKFTNEVFCKKVGLSVPEAAFMGLPVSDTKKYDREYSRQYRLLKKAERIKKGEMKFQTLDKQGEKAKQLKRRGLKVDEIAKALSLSLSSAYRLLRRESEAWKERQKRKFKECLQGLERAKNFCHDMFKEAKVTLDEAYLLLRRHRSLLTS